MLVGEGGADGEAGGDSACSSAELQLVGVLRRGKCSGAAAATGREGRTGGARGRRSELGRVRFDPGQPWVQQLASAADANPGTKVWHVLSARMDSVLAVGRVRTGVLGGQPRRRG